MNAPKLLIGLHFNKTQGKFINPPFLDQAPLSAFYSLSTEIFEPPPLSVNFGKPQSPFRGSELCVYIMFDRLPSSSYSRLVWYLGDGKTFHRVVIYHECPRRNELHLFCKEIYFNLNND